MNLLALLELAGEVWKNCRKWVGIFTLTTYWAVQFRASTLIERPLKGFLESDPLERLVSLVAIVVILIATTNKFAMVWKYHNKSLSILAGTSFLAWGLFLQVMIVVHKFQLPTEVPTVYIGEIELLSIASFLYHFFDVMDMGLIFLIPDDSGERKK